MSYTNICNPITQNESRHVSDCSTFATLGEQSQSLLILQTAPFWAPPSAEQELKFSPAYGPPGSPRSYSAERQENMHMKHQFNYGNGVMNKHEYKGAYQPFQRNMY
jgi:hypothetical protein